MKKKRNHDTIDLIFAELRSLHDRVGSVETKINNVEAQVTNHIPTSLFSQKVMMGLGYFCGPVIVILIDRYWKIMYDFARSLIGM